MFDLLLYSGMLCADADALVFRIQANKSELSPKIVIELVETVKESVPECSHCLLYTSPSPRDGLLSRMPSSA